RQSRASAHCLHQDDLTFSLCRARCTLVRFFVLFFFNDPAPTDIYTLSLHDALPISSCSAGWPFPFQSSARGSRDSSGRPSINGRSEEHTSELQSRRDLVCRLLLEKKKKTHA